MKFLYYYFTSFKKTIFSIILLNFILLSCTGVFFRNIDHDRAIYKELTNTLKDEYPDYFKDVNIIVYDGSVLLTGFVPTTSAQNLIATRTAKLKKVQKVYDELRIGSPRNISQHTADNILAKSVKTRMFASQKIYSSNFTISSVQGTIYIIGWARNKIEHDEIVKTVKSVSGVQKVVSYIKEVQ